VARLAAGHALLAVKAASAGINVVIVTADKDFVQLVNERIALYHPGKNGRGGQQSEWTDHTNAHERFGVPVERVTDFMALVGDTADNVPGAKGIGPSWPSSWSGSSGASRICSAAS